MIPTFATSLTNRKLIYVLDMPSFQRDFASLKTLDHGTGPAITFERASNATFFDATGTLQTAGNNVPRFDHDPASGNSLGLLIEEARTNIALHSADLASAHWTKTSVVVTSNTDVAPDGTTTADTVEDTTTGSTDHLISNPALGGAANAETFTWSFFIKKTTGATNYPAARLLFSGGTAIQAQAVIDTNNGTITSTGGSVISFTASVQNAGSYWRVICTGTNSSTGNTNVSGRIHPAYNSDGTIIQDVNATGSVVVWAGQLEKGAFPTSYIPTTTAAATRSADSAVVTPIASFYNQVEGTLFAEYQGARPAASVVDVSDQTFSNRLALARLSGGTLAAFGRNADAIILSIEVGVAPSITDTIKFAGAFKSDDFQAGRGGALGTADTSGAMPTVTHMRVGSGGNGTAFANGHIRKVAYYPKRLSNTLLQQLTT